MSKKIKNPELYIKRLKKRIGCLEKWGRGLEDRLKRIRGEIVITWTPHEGIQMTDCFYLARLRPNDHIAIIGKVKKVEAWIKEGCNNKQSQITYEVLETRKIE